MTKIVYRLFSVCLVIALFMTTGIIADAKPGDKSTEEIEEERDETQEKLDEVNTTIEELAELSEEAQDQLDEADCALVQILAELEVIEQQISDKEDEIVVATETYNDAVEKENEQYEAMKVRIRYLYEAGNVNLISIYMETGSISETLTKAEYIEELYSYDRQMLLDYQDTVQQVEQLKQELELEKEELIEIQTGYQEEQAYLEVVVDELKAISDSYAVELSAARNQAAVYAKQLKEQNREIARREAEAKKKAAEEAAKKAAEEKKKKEEEKKKAEEEKKKSEEGSTSDNTGDEGEESTQDEDQTDPSDDTPAPGDDTPAPGDDTPAPGDDTPPESTPKYDVSSIYAAKGSDLGKEIAVYGCQFIGNPYVPGGTSLTDGADCSGFVFSVYKHFGYSVPRTSYALRSAGTEVSYEDAEPGDVICYPGHVAIYLGNGMIVHASTQKTGIKVSNAQYRSILCVRRII